MNMTISISEAAKKLLDEYAAKRRITPAEYAADLVSDQVFSMSDVQRQLTAIKSPVTHTGQIFKDES